MVNEKIREAYEEYGKEQEMELVFFESPAFDNSIIGHTEEGRLVYSFDKMIAELAQEFLEDDTDGIYEDDEMTAFLDAEEFIDYNTLRSLPYWNSQGIKAPIIIYDNVVEMAKYMAEPKLTGEEDDV